MNDQLESQLRAAFQREAVHVDGPADPLSRIHGRVAVRHRRRRSAAILGAVATVGLAVGGFLALGDRSPAIDPEVQGSAPLDGVATVPPDVPFLVPMFVPAELTDRRATEWSLPSPEVNPLQETLYVYRRAGDAIGQPTILVAVQPPAPDMAPVGPITESRGVLGTSGLVGNHSVSLTARGIDRGELDGYVAAILAGLAGDVPRSTVGDFELVATYDDAGANDQSGIGIDYSPAGPDDDFHPGISIYTLRAGSGALLEYDVIEPGTSIEPTVVRGHPAIAVLGGDSRKLPDQDLGRITRLTWEEEPGLLVSVSGIDYDVDVLRQVTESLAPVDRATWVAMLGVATAPTTPTIVGSPLEPSDQELLQQDLDLQTQQLLTLYPPRVLLVSDGWTHVNGDLARFAGGSQRAATIERVWRDPLAGLWDRFVVVRAERGDVPDDVGQHVIAGQLQESVEQVNGFTITLSSFGLSDAEHRAATQSVHQSITESGTLPDSIGLTTNGSPWASFAAPDGGGTIGFREERVVSYGVGYDPFTDRPPSPGDDPTGPGAYASIMYERADAIGGTPSVEIRSQTADQMWSLIVERMRDETATIERVTVGGISQAIQAIDFRLEELSARLAELGTPADGAGEAELETVRAQQKAYVDRRLELEARLGSDPDTAGYDAVLITLPAEDRHWLIWRQDGATVEVDFQGLSTDEANQLIPGLVESDQETWTGAING